MIPDKHLELHKAKNNRNEGKQEKLFDLFLSFLTLSVGLIGFCLLNEVGQSTLIFLLSFTPSAQWALGTTSYHFLGMASLDSF